MSATPSVPHYIDASIAVKLLVREPDSDRVREYVNKNIHYRTLS
jgi:predicted nucleic acid-binding protein